MKEAFEMDPIKGDPEIMIGTPCIGGLRLSMPS